MNSIDRYKAFLRRLNLRTTARERVLLRALLLVWRHGPGPGALQCQKRDFQRAAAVLHIFTRGLGK